MREEEATKNEKQLCLVKSRKKRITKMFKSDQQREKVKTKNATDINRNKCSTCLNELRKIPPNGLISFSSLHPAVQKLLVVISQCNEIIYVRKCCCLAIQESEQASTTMMRA